jgi:hypothetical protein
MTSLPRRHPADLVAVILLVFCVVSAAACGPEPCHAECANSDLVIESIAVANHEAAEGPDFSVTASGSACGDPSSCGSDGATVTSCELPLLFGAGTCHVEVTFANGRRIVKDITMQYSGGDCCAGWYPDDGLIDTTPPADAGAE